MDVRSPLTGSPDVELVRAIDTERVISAWKRHYQIDVRPQFRGHRTIGLYRCRRTRLRFFHPPEVAGDGKLYEQLQRFDWYYLADKWEHGEALRDLRGIDGPVLEVGCGSGAFLRRLQEAGVSAEGIELNESAVAAAQEAGLRVWAEPVESAARSRAGRYAAVCAFQVLEHIPNPREFLSALTALLRPGGLLLLAVPNEASFIRHATRNLLDAPPHHMTHWTPDAFAALTAVFPLTLVRTAREPLADYHVDWYLSVQTGRLGLGRLSRPITRALQTALAPALRRTKAVRQRIAGHSLYAGFRLLG